jgi:hypothetical protein
METSYINHTCGVQKKMLSIVAEHFFAVINYFGVNSFAINLGTVLVSRPWFRAAPLIL